MRLLHVVIATAAGVALAACAKGDGDIAPTDSAGGIIDSAPATVAQAVAARLSDENVFAFLDTSYVAILEFDRLGQERATDPQVKALADRGSSQHALQRREAAAMAQRLGIISTLPDRDIVKDHAEAMTELRGKSGQDFDRAFLERWIEINEELLDEIEDADVELRNENVRTFLNQLRATAETDLRAARDLRQKLGEG